MDNEAVMKVSDSLHDLPDVESRQALGYFASEFLFRKLSKHGTSYEAHDDIVSLTICEDVFG